jgi:hypothetical protein
MGVETHVDPCFTLVSGCLIVKNFVCVCVCVCACARMCAHAYGVGSVDIFEFIYKVYILYIDNVCSDPVLRIQLCNYDWVYFTIIIIC